MILNMGRFIVVKVRNMLSHYRCSNDAFFCSQRKAYAKRMILFSIFSGESEQSAQ